MKNTNIGTAVLRTATKQKAFVAIMGIVALMALSPLFGNENNFFTQYNIFDMLNSTSILVIVGFGITLVIIAGGIDLSVGGTYVIGGIVAIQCMNVMPIPLAIVCSVLVCAGIGAINGYLVVYHKLEPFIITLGMGFLLKGVALQITDARPVSPKSLAFMKIANYKIWGTVPRLIPIMLVFFVLVYVLLRYTQYGRNLYAIGGDYEVAEYSGIKVRIIKASTYVLSASLSGVAGILLSSKLNSGSAVYGDLITLYVICACVVGGISLAGGVGGATRALLGLLMFGVMQNALNMLSIDPYIQDLIIGIVIVTIIGLDSYSRKRKREMV